jgi:hypothetical protein
MDHHGERKKNWKEQNGTEVDEEVDVGNVEEERVIWLSKL